jgi:hypothetical protein
MRRTASVTPMPMPAAAALLIPDGAEVAVLAGVVCDDVDVVGCDGVDVGMAGEMLVVRLKTGNVVCV